jgi:hypothetical protein
MTVQQAYAPGRVHKGGPVKLIHFRVLRPHKVAGTGYVPEGEAQAGLRLPPAIRWPP